MKVSGYQGCENGGGLGVSDFDQSCWLDGTRNSFHHRINWLGADIDPDQYPQIPSQWVVEGQEQDGMEVCKWWIQCTQSFVFNCS